LFVDIFEVAVFPSYSFIKCVKHLHLQKFVLLLSVLFNIVLQNSLLGADSISSITGVQNGHSHCVNTFKVGQRVPPLDCNISLQISWVNGLSCFGTGGAVQLAAIGGVAPYTFMVVNTSSGEVYSGNSGLFTGLPSGDYNAFVFDVNQCQPPCKLNSFTINRPSSALDHSVTVDYGCYNNFGHSLVLNSNSGSSLLYSIGGSFTTSNVFNNLTPGVYQTSVMDSFGCVSVETVTINAVTPITVNVSQVNHEWCGNGLGSIALSANGGMAPYSFTLFNANQQLISSNTTGLFTGLSSGTYFFSVTDANGCLSKLNKKKPIKLLNNCNPCVSNKVASDSLPFSVFRIWPNPANEKVMVSYESQDLSGLTISIVNITGQVLTEWSSLFGKGEIELDVSNYLPGSYFVRFQGAGGELMLSEQLIIIK
jgi:hypothetical protein